MAASSPSPTISGSTCTLQTVQGTHYFKIDGYSLCRGLSVDTCIKSRTFAVGGYDWCLHIYPNGDSEDSKDWVSAYLKLKTKNAKVRVNYHMRLVDRTTRPPQPVSTWTKREPKVFDTHDDKTVSWGYDKFEKKTEVEEFIMDDALIIECSIAVIKLMDAEDEDIKIIGDIRVPPSYLVHELSEFMEAREGADVFFKVKEEVFPAHKFILAVRSPVFRAEFHGPMRDEHERSVTVEGIQPAVFKGLLHFIYTDSLPPMDELSTNESEDMLRHLLLAADRYAMDRMKLMCKRELCKSFSAENVATTLALADQHHCIKLKDACIEFMTSLNRVNDVVASRGYENLKRSCPTIFVDLWERAAKTRKN